MENPSSPLETLRQLKEMLDAGTITPTEFEALKQQLVFSKPGAEAVPVAPTPPAALPLATPVASSFEPEVRHTEPVAPTATFTQPAYRAPAPTSNPPSNPLNLVLIIGGALAVLALVLYLALGNRTPDEHLTSTTQTAADSLSTTEIGPQEEQITLPPVAAPETIRIAPAHPATPITRPQPAPTTDSVTTLKVEKPAANPDTL